MLTEDYLMRLIRLTVAALAKIVGLKAALLYQDAQVLIDQTLEQIFGMRVDLIKRLEDNHLLAALTFQEILDLDRVLLVAELFKEDGEILAALGQTSASRASYLRALNFYLESVLSPGELNFPAPHEQIAAILQAIEGQKLPAETLYPLFCYYEDAGRFQDADRRLTDLAQEGDMMPEILSEFQEFYTRLEVHSEDQLNAGGFTREEVAKTLAEIQTKGQAWLDGRRSRPHAEEFDVSD